MIEQVTSLDLSLKLKEAGAPQKGGHWRWYGGLDPMGNKRHVSCILSQHSGSSYFRAFTVGEMLAEIRQLGWLVSVGLEMDDGDRVDGEYMGGKVFASASIWHMVVDDEDAEEPTYSKQDLIGFSAATVEEAAGNAYCYALWKLNPPT